MAVILVVAEHASGQLKASTFHLLAAAAQLGADINVLLAGTDLEASLIALRTHPRVPKILLVESAVYDHFMAEPWTELLAHCLEDRAYTHVLMPANSMGKNILPRLAARRDQGMVSDVIAIEGQDIFKRPIYAGNAIATLRSLDSPHLLTIRTTAFPMDQDKEAKHDAAVERLTYEASPGKAVFQALRQAQTKRPALSDARIVISGGRGLKNAETFALLESIADRLGAAVGASRAAVDAGLVPNEYQVGQTGQIVAPDLYIAVGISGAIQHLAGMRGSRVIVAINQDEEAPIFQVADYGLVADLFNVLPALLQRLPSG